VPSLPRTRAPNEIPTVHVWRFTANVPHGSMMQQGCCCLLLWDPAVVSGGHGLATARQSAQHVASSPALHGTTRHSVQCSLLFSSLPLSFPTHPVTTDPVCGLPCSAPAAWTRSASAYIALPAGAAYRLCTSSRINKTPSTHCRYHMPALCVLTTRLHLS
jgi:hypothetical protein